MILRSFIQPGECTVGRDALECLDDAVLYPVDNKLLYLHRVVFLSGMGYYPY